MSAEKKLILLGVATFIALSYPSPCFSSFVPEIQVEELSTLWKSSSPFSSQIVPPDPPRSTASESNHKTISAHDILIGTWEVNTGASDQRGVRKKSSGGLSNYRVAGEAYDIDLKDFRRKTNWLFKVGDDGIELVEPRPESSRKRPAPRILKVDVSQTESGLQLLIITQEHAFLVSGDDGLNLPIPDPTTGGYIESQPAYIPTRERMARYDVILNLNGTGDGRWITKDTVLRSGEETFDKGTVTLRKLSNDPRTEQEKDRDAFNLSGDVQPNREPYSSSFLDNYVVVDDQSSSSPVYAPSTTGDRSYLYQQESAPRAPVLGVSTREGLSPPRGERATSSGSLQSARISKIDTELRLLESKISALERQIESHQRSAGTSATSLMLISTEENLLSTYRQQSLQLEREKIALQRGN